MENFAKDAAEVGATVARNRLQEMLSSWKNERMKSMQSWSLFFDRKKLAMPKVVDIPSRMKSNVVHFQTNYIILFFVLCIYSILTNPLFLLAVGASAALWMYAFHWRKDPLKILNHEVTDKEKTIVLSILTLGLFYFASVGNTIFWLIGATLTVVVLHSFFLYSS